MENNTHEEKKFFIIIKVIDGDTYTLDNGDKIRLIGIDTPEMRDSEKLDKDADKSGQSKETIKKLGSLATEFARKNFEGKKVYLEKEPGEDKDRYGRLLRYVYLEDGRCINAILIEQGYAYVYDRFPFTKQTEFRKLFKEARENKKGLWAD
ncbi:MAG TPA: thermonuclease [Bacteroidetes bacterium]|nr:thermonuclease [Bacteroidota bacterium]